ncbi:IS110 family transposase [Lactobacillus xujianguonis]|uniref:IS110 family transposase n=1 Tax=Lactobacillus xujianguonis TaxID=2495899 RepID=UPI000FD888E4|nr:IS110 family transposase [Lactobacillus xujianguonis]RVU71879.1 IS110 family transposase [Lactobacillus xujianguonis]
MVFGIDISSKSSSVCIMVRAKEFDSFTITNDLGGFNVLLDQLQCYANPVVVFEATGVYSLPLQSFLDRHNYNYVRLNPLKAKKLMDNNLRHLKTDKLDAKHLAELQFNSPQQLSPKQDYRYHEMQNASRFYEELTNDLVKWKNRLHRALQSTFPQIERLTSSHSGEVYWQIVNLFPHAKFVLNSAYDQIVAQLNQIKGIGHAKANTLACSLQTIAKRTCYYDDYDSITVELGKYCIERLRGIEQRRKHILEYIKEIASNPRDVQLYATIPGIADTTALRIYAELGDLRRFNNRNQINAFIGIDPGRSQSGDVDNHLSVTKHGNAIARKILYRTIGQMETVKSSQPCHITDYYDYKKQLSKARGYKKAAIASMHKLIRTIYALIINDQPYDYRKSLHNQS